MSSFADVKISSFKGFNKNVAFGFANGGWGK